MNIRPTFIRTRPAWTRQTWMVSELERTAADYAARLKSPNALYQPEAVLEMWAEKQRTLERAASIMRGRLGAESDRESRDAERENEPYKEVRWS